MNGNPFPRWLRAGAPLCPRFLSSVCFPTRIFRGRVTRGTRRNQTMDALFRIPPLFPRVIDLPATHSSYICMGMQCMRRLLRPFCIPYSRTSKSQRIPRADNSGRSITNPPIDASEARDLKQGPWWNGGEKGRSGKRKSKKGEKV